VLTVSPSLDISLVFSPALIATHLQAPHPTQCAHPSSTFTPASRFRPIRLFPVPSRLSTTVRDGWIDVDNFLPIHRPSRVLPHPQPRTWVRALANPALPNADLFLLGKFHSQILPFAYGCLPRVDVSPLQTVSIRNPGDPRWCSAGADSRMRAWWRAGFAVFVRLPSH